MTEISDQLTDELANTSLSKLSDEVRQIVRDIDSYMLRCQSLGMEPMRSLVIAREGWRKALADYDAQ